MSVRTMAKVWDQSVHTGTELLMMLAIADFSDDEGRAYPSIHTLAKKCRMKPRNTRYIMSALTSSGELEIHYGQGPKGTNLYRINIHALGVQHSAGVQYVAGVQHSAGGAAIQCTKPLQYIAPKPSVNHQEPKEQPALPTATSSSCGANKKSSPISLPAWLKNCEAEGVSPIPENDPVFDFVETAGIPVDLLAIAWSEFKEKHGDGSKRQKDWRKTFRNAVRGNWYKIWFTDAEGNVQISSQGRTLQKVHQEVA